MYLQTKSTFPFPEKVCTTLTSGWFRDFAIDNYPEILKLYDHSKFEYVKNQLQEDIANDQISIQEYVDPFTGEQVKEGKK